ncbi:unnamed protein product (macronuclear) [Paramecium tetraurelia]|uniref:Uncharacterized protein n=1 Tax=Paramecium tetraurelia TaxID=5888 RepID=A0E3J3_PARTE|nr:uncharacterized protein GSPATT00023033001 [Paramecium tetraurelia]CAK89860.1 unnamed protein product [Paramecium tetraurelia]|eukprot:XP_001457257.1 hypothetical protein (macronuclear) [Paramecium tetraurelia strain d4-2]
MEPNDQESILLKLIEKFQRLMDQFNKNKKRNISVVLLVGVTGSGKSTIFNFLSGADFIIDENNELVIKNPSNKFSKMIGGMNSVTKEPNFYHNTQNNHLIVDFPGFQDTNGEWDQLLFELLFYKIVTSGPIKIIYVIKTPENSLPNRGSDLQEFIKQVFLKGNVNIQQFNLLLNCYLEDLQEEQLRNKIKDDLKYVNLSQQIDKILIVRKAKKNDQLNQIFNHQQRQILWQQIEQMQAIKILPQKLPKSEIISDYLRSTTLQTIEKYGNVLCDLFDNSFTTLSESQSQKTQQQMQKLLQVIKIDNNESPLNWYTNFISICEELTKNLPAKSNILNSNNNFKEIFVYFSQFSDLIKGYDEMTIMKSIAQDQLKKVEEIIYTRLKFLEKAQKDRAKISQMENQKNKLQLSMISYESQIKNLSNELDQSKSQINKSKSEKDKIERENQSQIRELQRQLALARQSHSNIDDEQKNHLQRQNSEYQNNIQILKQQLREYKQNEETEKLKKKVQIQNEKINTLEKENDILKKRPTSSSNSSCQLI